MNIIEKLILSKYPNFDFNRYRFNTGDIVKLDDGAIVIIKEAALEFVYAYVYRRSLTYRSFGEVKVFYDSLPYYNKGEFESLKVKPSTNLKWNVGDIVRDPEYGTIVYLYQCVGFQDFYGYVLESDNNYYLHTGICIRNVNRNYIAET